MIFDIVEEEKEEDNSMNLENGGERDQTILELRNLIIIFIFF